METMKYFIWTFLIFNLQVSANPKKDWWKYTQIYEVFIWSFKDSNGDGIGDIKGITTMLDHFVDLKIETLWLSPYFKSPMKDMGYDVSNFMDIDPRFGTLDDFDELAKEAKKRGLKILMDLVINHSSDTHEWFQLSQNGTKPYDKYYVWQPSKGQDQNGNPIPPNNWLSLFGGSAWKWNDKRKMFYLHQFAASQPELNLRDENLKTELKKIMKFWIDRGVAGFRMDATKHYMEDLQLRDEPLVNPNIDKKEVGYFDLSHIYTTDLPEVYEFIHEIRQWLDQNFNGGHDFEKILVVEAYSDMPHTMQYYGTKNHRVVHFPFNFGFTTMRNFPSARELDALINDWLKNMPPGGVPNWVAENHDNYRIGNRFNEEFMDIMTTLMLMLPGVPCLYYGQEIGMMDNTIRPDQLRDLLVGRDPERLPMQWDDTLNAGFSTKHKPWLPLNPNFWRVNVRYQKEAKVSRYQMFKKMSELRQTVTGKRGVFKSYILAPWVYAFTRSYRGRPTYVMVFNLGTEQELIDLHSNIFGLTRKLKVITSSMNSGYSSGSEIQYVPVMPLMLSMRPISCVVLSTTK